MNVEVRIDQELKVATETLITAADTLDIAILEKLYAPEFKGIRMDKSGNVVQFTKNELLSFYRHMDEAGSPSIKTKDTHITFAEFDGHKGFVLAVRSKVLSTDWETISYNLFWEQRNSQWQLVREFAFH